MPNLKASERSIDLARYKLGDTDFAHLSLRDLVEARELYHVHLARHPNVVATGLGRYRIRIEDSWPNDRRQHHGTGRRTLENSTVRPYSWPCILVFVTKWEDPKDFVDRPGDMVPTTLFMPDGRKIPVCLIEAPRDAATPTAAPQIAYPIDNLGPGRPIVARVQGQDYVATVGCLVSDGHKVYAMSNRHVTGDEGEIVNARLGWSEDRIGVSSGKQLTRRPFEDLYPSLGDKDTFVNVDIGLIELDDIRKWTTKVAGIGVPGSMVDFSDRNISFSLLGCRVCGVGAAGGKMIGEVHALFYRYKSMGGFDFVADLMIGPVADEGVKQVAPFKTLPGDSGTMWMLAPKPDGRTKDGDGDYLPLAVQWGRNMLESAGSTHAQGFALATLLSRACALLEVDVLRDWNVDQSDTWGAIGHFSIASRGRVALSDRVPKLSALMEANAEIISRSDADIGEGDFTGMGSDAFVPLADVPDFFWKKRVAKQGHDRPFEGPNHFADMDQKGPDGQTLLDLTENDANIDPDIWERFYDSVRDLLSGDPIKPEHRGLLPFRVWQIFDAMVGYVATGDLPRFICAAGVLTHYIGDACQPLHISYLHDGDPLQPIEHTFSKGKKAGQTEKRPLGQGVHSAYEDAMVFDHRNDILEALSDTPVVGKSELVNDGFSAAKRTIDLMRATFKLIPPKDIVTTFVGVGHSGKAASNALWGEFGANTLEAMKQGSHLVGLLWESAWEAGGGEGREKANVTLKQDQAMSIVADDTFLPSLPVGRIGSVLKRGQAPQQAANAQPASRGRGPRRRSRSG